MFGASLEQEAFRKETLSIRAIMSNGLLPSRYLQVNSITEATNFPEGMAVTNLTAPSDVLPCPERQNFLWSLISHLTVSYTTLADTTTLRTLLSLYNWSPIENNPIRKKIHSGLVNVQTPCSKNLYRDRRLIRGIEFGIDIDARYFENGEGDIHLFGLVLSKFLSQYVTINSSVMLKLVDTKTNKAYSWDANQGSILPI
jgi:type VI secretion system protein ImpG